MIKRNSICFCLHVFVLSMKHKFKPFFCLLFFLFCLCNKENTQSGWSVLDLTVLVAHLRGLTADMFVSERGANVSIVTCQRRPCKVK